MHITRSLFSLAASVCAALALACGYSGPTVNDPCGGVCGTGLVCGPNATCVPANATGGGDGTGSGGNTNGNGNGGGSSSAGRGLPCNVQQVLDSYCTSCHGTTPTNAAPFSIVTRADLIKDAPAGGSVGSRCVFRMQNTQIPMPPQGFARPSSSEVSAFVAWVNSGMPEGSCLASGGIGGGNGSDAGTGGTGATDAGTSGGVDAGSGSGGTGTADAGTSGGGTSTGNYCAPCTSDTDCGGGSNYCIGFSFGDYCGTDCSNGQTCPANTRCATLVDGNQNPVGQNCVPLQGQTCQASGGGGGGGGGTGTNYCSACTSDADCGGGNNFCLGFSFGDYCGSDCGNGQACPANAHCATIVDNFNNPIGQNCVPNSGSTCQSSGGGTGGGTGGTDAGTSGGGGTGGTDAGTCTPDTWSGWPKTFFVNNCSGCHGTEFSSHTTVTSKRTTIQSDISTGYMPKGFSLSSTDKNRILTWLGCGAP